MSRINWKPGNMLFPLPVVMVSCGKAPDNYNITTVAWTGTVNTNPPMCYISLKKSRLSHEIISDFREFVINLTNEKLAFVTDWCGVKSGRDFNKFKEMKLHYKKGTVVDAPIIKESPVALECKVHDIVSYNSHDMFIAEIVNVSVDDIYLNSKTNAFEMHKTKLISYIHGKYYTTEKIIGKFGFSVKKGQ